MDKKRVKLFSSESFGGATPKLATALRSTVAANIDYSLASELSYFFLQLQIGPTNLFMVVPRNDAIFPKLHTNRY